MKKEKKVMTKNRYTETDVDKLPEEYIEIRENEES